MSVVPVSVVPVSVVPVSVVGAKEVPNMASVTGTGRKTSCNNYYSNTNYLSLRMNLYNSLCHFMVNLP